MSITATTPLPPSGSGPGASGSAGAASSAAQTKLNNAMDQFIGGFGVQEFQQLIQDTEDAFKEEPWDPKNPPS